MALNTGNPYIDALGETEWPDELSVFNVHFHDGGDGGAWTTAERLTFEHALRTWEAVADIRFVTTTDPARAHLVEKKATDAAWPDEFDAQGRKIPDPQGRHDMPKMGAEGWYNTSQPYWNSMVMGIGGAEHTLFIHEIGHALGLGHPHREDAQDTLYFPGAEDPFGTSWNALNQNIYTVMSYVEPHSPAGADYGFAGTPMAFDIAAIQATYGANVGTNGGDNVYVLADENGFGTMYSCIWDVGGDDTIVYQGTKQATIDLRPATLRNEWGGGGFLSSVAGIYGGFTIAADFTNRLADVGTDTGVVIENASGGGGNDQITGNAADNLLQGNRGEDRLYGLDGNDRLDGGEGADVMDGGAGNDIYIVDSFQDRVYETAINDAGQLVDSGGIDEVITSLSSYTLSSDMDSRVEHLTFNGGDVAFTGTGNQWDNRIIGSNAGGTLSGGGGRDTLIGFDGNDVLDGGTGDDYMRGGGGNDTYFVDSLGDEVSESGNDELDVEFDRGGVDEVRTTLSAYTLSDSPVSVIENLTSIGTGGFTGIGNQADNRITGGGGADNLDGGGGDDTLAGGLGDDTYWNVDDAGDVIIENAGQGSDTVYTQRSGYVLGANLENLWVVNTGAFGATRVGHGNGENNTIGSQDYGVPPGFEPLMRFELYGHGGRDIIIGNNARAGDLLDGGSGDDELYGFGGADLLRGGLGADRLEGGEGSDRADYALATAGVIADLIGGGSGGEAQGDSYFDIEGINGSAFADRLLGSNNADFLSGSGGADRIEGRRGDDTLTGGADADTFVFASGWGRDIITDFTIGQDRLDMTGVSGLSAMSQLSIAGMMSGTRISFGADTIMLAGVNAAQLSASSFQFAAPATPAGQTYNGTAAWGTTLTGTAGIDTVTYASATHAIFADLARSGVNVEGLGAGRSASVVGIENVTGSSTGLNYLHGNQANNVLVGGSASDWLNGRGGSNTLDGRGGVDTADYYEMGAAVGIDLTTGRATHGSGIDTLIGIEQFRGTFFADSFIGDAVDNYFQGMSGNDTIRGNGGADWLEGSDGSDTIDGGTGNDRIFGGYGNDLLTGGVGADRFVFRDSEYGQDRITDFSFASGDRIDFGENAAVNRYADLSIASGATGAVIRYATSGGQSSITLDGISAAAITQEWFAF